MRCWRGKNCLKVLREVITSDTCEVGKSSSGRKIYTDPRVCKMLKECFSKKPSRRPTSGSIADTMNKVLDDPQIGRFRSRNFL